MRRYVWLEVFGTTLRRGSTEAAPLEVLLVGMGLGEGGREGRGEAGAMGEEEGEARLEEGERKRERRG